MENSIKFVVFALEDQKYALPLSQVEKVIRSVEITPLPKAPEIVSGIINMQGGIVPVFNLRKRFRLPERDLDIEDHMLVAIASSRIVTFGVDRVEGIIELPREQIIPHGKIHPEMEYVEGVIKLESGMIFIHELGRFLSLEEKAELESALKKAEEK